MFVESLMSVQLNQALGRFPRVVATAILLVAYLLASQPATAQNLGRSREEASFNRFLCANANEPSYPEFAKAFWDLIRQPALQHTFVMAELAHLANTAGVTDAEKMAFAQTIEASNGIPIKLFGALVSLCALVQLAVIDDTPNPVLLEQATLHLQKRGAEGRLAAPAMRRALELAILHPTPDAFKAWAETSLLAQGHPGYAKADRIAIAALLYRFARVTNDARLVAAAQAGAARLTNDPKWRGYWNVTQFVTDTLQTMPLHNLDYDWARNVVDRWARIRGRFDPRFLNGHFWNNDLNTILKIADAHYSLDSMKSNNKSSLSLSRAISDDAWHLRKEQMKLWDAGITDSVLENRMVSHRRKIEEAGAYFKVAEDIARTQLLLGVGNKPQELPMAMVAEDLIDDKNNLFTGAVFDWKSRELVREAVQKEFLRLDGLSSVYPPWEAHFSDLAFQLAQAATVSTGRIASARRLARDIALPKADVTADQLFEMQLEMHAILRRMLAEVPERPVDPHELTQFQRMFNLSKRYTSGNIAEKFLNRWGAAAKPLVDEMFPPSVPASVVGSALKPNEAAVIVFPFGRGTAVFGLRHNRLVFRVNQVSSAEINESAARLRRQLDGDESHLFDFDLDSAKTLHRASFGVVADVLSDVEHVFWIGFDGLGEVNPAILHDGRRFAIESYAISSLPNIRSLLTRDRYRIEHDLKGARFVGIGGIGVDQMIFEHGVPESGSVFELDTIPQSDPDPAVDVRSSPALGQRMAEPLQPLLRTPELLDRVADLIGPNRQILKGEQATFENIQVAAPTAEVLLFATHGVLGHSGGAFYPPGLEITPSELWPTEFLQNSQIHEMDFSNAQLVILAACESGTGSGSVGATAFSGLVEAFVGAGARTVIASHWKIEEDAAVDLIPIVMQKILAGQASAFAMRAAMIEFIGQPDPRKSHPRYWGALAVIGDGSQ